MDGDTCGGPTIEEWVKVMIPNPHLNDEVCIGTQPPIYTTGGLKIDLIDDEDFKMFWKDGDEDGEGWLALYMDLVVVVHESSLVEAEAILNAEQQKAREEEEARIAREAEEAEEAAREAREAEEAARAAREAEEEDAEDEADASGFELKRRKKKAGKRLMRKQSIAELKGNQSP